MGFTSNIVFLIILITYLGIVISNDPTTSSCLENIYREFGFGINRQERPHNNRKVWPTQAFFKFVEKDFKSEEGKGYYKHIHDVMLNKEGMQIPRQYCNSYEEPEKLKCLTQLITMFSNKEDKLAVLQDTFWNFKDTDFANINADGTVDMSKLFTINRDSTISAPEDIFYFHDNSTNYRYLYFYYLSMNHYFPNDVRDLPMTPREYCYSRKHEEKTKKRKELLSNEKEASSSKKTITRVNRIQDLFAS